jgi:hypothetical protein
LIRMYNQIVVIGGMLLSLLAADAGAKAFSIDSVRTYDVPKVQNSTVTYALDMRFKERPEEYWAFYDTVKKLIIIDFYNAWIDTQKINLKKNKVFKKITITNLNTNMALSGERAQVQIEADPGWHVEASSIEKRIIRITVWRPIQKTGKKAMGRPWVRFLYLGIPLAVGCLVFVLERSFDK